MGEIPKYKVVEGARETHKALKKLRPEDRKAIQSADVGSIRAMVAEKKVAPETVTAAADKYYQEHPELEKPLKRVEELVKAEK